MYRYRPFIKNEFRRYPFLVLLPPLCCGIFIQYSFAKGINAGFWLIALLISGIAAIAFHKLHAVSRVLQYSRNISIVFLLFFLGASLAYYQDNRNINSWYGNGLRHAQALCLKVEGCVQPKERTIFIPVTVMGLYKNGQWEQTTGKLRLYVYKQGTLPVIKPGDWLIIPADKVFPIKNSGNPFAFDYAGYAARSELFHQVFIAAKDIYLIPDASIEQTLLTRIRTLMLHNIRLNIGDGETASLVEATMLNERTMLDEEIWRAYSTTGIVHIIAISGMHVALLFHILLFFLLWIKNKKLEWVKYFIAIPLVWFYVSLTGFPPSAVRAAAMFTLLAFGLKLNRETNSINILMATAFILLCCNPFWLYDTGFQLSFSAVLSILIFYQPIRRWYCPHNRLSRFVWNTFATSLAVQVLTFPLTIFYFHQFPLWVLIANIPATIFSLLLMISSLALLIVSVFTTCTWLGDLIILFTKSFHAIILCLAQNTPLFFQRLFIDTISFWLLLLAVVLLAISLLKKKQNYLVAGIIAISALIADIGFQHYTTKRQKRIVVYNVSRFSLIDFFNGATIQYYGTPFDSLDQKTINYVLLPSRFGYHATTNIPPREECLWAFNGKRIYFLNEKSPAEELKPMKIDYLIVSNRCTFDITQWKNIFDPGKIIIDGSLPRWKAIHWKQEIVRAGIPVYWVQECGAWIFPQ